MRSRLSVAILSLALCLFSGTAKMYAAPTSDEVSFRYRISKVEVDARLNPNGENMDKLESILTGPNASKIQRIEMRASSSPEGPYYLNERYAHERAEWIKAFITGRYPSLPASVWQVEEVPEDWDGVADYLRRSTEDYKAEAMQIVRSNSSNRKELLQDLYAGEAWDDLYQYAFPWLRAVKLRIVYSDTPVSGQQQEEQQQQQQQQEGQQQGQGQQEQRPPRISEPIVSEGALAIFFERSITAVKPEFHRNILDIERIKDEVGRGANKLEMVGYASPEGTTAVNQSISKKRLEAARNYLSKQTGIPLDSISVKDAGEDWSGLAKAVESSYEGSDREEVLRVLRDDTLSQDAKENSLKKLDGGRTWQSLIKDQMTDLRRVEVSCITVESEPEVPEIPEIIENEIDIPQEEVEVEEVDVEVEPTDITVETIELPEEPVIEPVGKYPRPVLGVYTNLLYDAATAFNLGLEIPLGRHLTINADAIYTDMPFYGNGNHMGLKIGELGAHYYFNDEGPGLKGWFVTANAGGGFYDLSNKTKRAEGSLFYLSGGAGYSFQLGPESSHWRLMLSAEMGPMRTPYKYYETNEAGNLYLKRQDDFMWGLPTRLEVSLMYVFYSKNKMF